MLVLATLLCSPLLASSACKSLHSKSHGVELACCSSASPLPPNCEFGSICDGPCTCRLLVSSDLTCSPNLGKGDHEWVDHSAPKGSLPCSRPSPPNPGSPYHVHIQGWRQNRTSAFLKGLCGTRVTKLIIEAYRVDDPLPELGNCFPSLETIDISLKYRQPLDLGKILASSSRLYSIKTLGVDFDLPITPPKWVNSIEFFHVEHSELSELPKWLAGASKLVSLVLKYTRLSSVSTVTQIGKLRSVRLSHNRIDDLHRHSFSNKELHDLDLSSNQIAHLATFSFSQCPNLRVLDLSSNPLRELPFRPFLKSSKLKWLKLSDTAITTLSADNFVGLTSLKTLTLSRSPLQSIAPFALLPLKSLRSLDLQACNLTRIPVAVTQNCGLTHLNLADNLLHRSSSLPPEVLALLSSLSQFRIEGNPLTEFPPSLLLLSTDNARLYRQLVLTTTQLPLWTADPCTPFYWHQHLRNKSLALRQLVASWDQAKMVREGLGHCQSQYEWMSEQMTIYRDLERSSGCSVSRRLRSSMQRTSSCPGNTTSSISLSSARLVPQHLPIGPPILLVISLATNVIFIFLILLFLCLLWSVGRRGRKY